MVVDYLTKPLTGEKFRKFRGQIMNVPYNAAQKTTGNMDGEVDTSKSMIKLQSGKTMMQVNNGFDTSESELEEVGIMKWARIDKDKKHYLTTKVGGPNWKNVTHRTTYNLDNGEIIEFLKIDDTLSNEFLHRRLPDDVVNIKTVLQSKDDDEEMAVKKGDLT